MSKPEKSVTDEYLRIVDLEPSEWDAQLQQIESAAVKEQIEKLLRSSLTENSADSTPEDDHESQFRSELLRRKIQVIKRVGSGGMAEVFLGVDLVTGRRVAIKRPRIEFSSASFIDRFKIEYQAISRLEHPNICRVKFAGEYSYTNGESWYFVMEYVEGFPLDVFLQTREPTECVVLDLLDQIVDATVHAHLQSIVHRDLKPDNILVTDRGDIKIIDFGICEIIHSTCSLTHVEAGTHEYSPPEQLQGKVSNSSMDSYSLGMVISKIISSGNVESVLKRPTIQALEHAKFGLTHLDDSKRLTLFELKKIFSS